MPTPTSIPGDAPDNAVVYITNPADGSVGRCTVAQYRGLYEAKGYGLASSEDYAAQEQEHARSQREAFKKNPEIFTPDGPSAAEVATSRKPLNAPTNPNTEA